MAEKSNGYWKGLVTGLFVVPVLAIVGTVIGTIVVALSGRRAIEDSRGG